MKLTDYALENHYSKKILKKKVKKWNTLLGPEGWSHDRDCFSQGPVINNIDSTWIGVEPLVW